jgi:hypothetical protein
MTVDVNAGAPFLELITCPLHVEQAGTDETVYCVTYPELGAGAVHDNDAEEFPGADDSATGASGTALGVPDTGDVVLDVPAALLAAIRNVYDTPLVRPTTTVCVGAGCQSGPGSYTVRPVHAGQDGLTSTAYCVMPAPPSDVGAVQASDTDLLYTAADTVVAGPGLTTKLNPLKTFTVPSCKNPTNFVPSALGIAPMIRDKPVAMASTVPSVRNTLYPP